MTAKEFVLSKYPDATAFRWNYDNSIGRVTYNIMKGNTFSVYFRNPNGSDTESAAWVYAKKTIQAGGKSLQEQSKPSHTDDVFGDIYGALGKILAPAKLEGGTLVLTDEQQEEAFKEMEEEVLRLRLLTHKQR